ncbi:DUF896 domain-containing protein [Geomicrobium sp. JSM 1781026]|uniref:DUF896 domain-containing protein n=1 Tax=unclassified Geomicrobium TaxID=2628951 RepID=UPI00045F2837|nr:DUF896 domain-containing protein [Geomicrobium sp. JCM 19039]GAK12777.1 hypothetical protein JCM19039_2578 [Geomicrobium sp. JCM 19039]
MIPIIDRINELAKKSKEVGLTEDERTEQSKLRQEYLSYIRGQVKDTMSNVTVVDENGDDVTPKRLKDDQEQRRSH